MAGELGINGRMAQKKIARQGCLGVLILGLACSLLFYFNFHTVVVSGHSMDPTLHSGQRLLVSKAFWLVGSIRDKDIVVTDSNPDGYIVKRVYKMGGETVDSYNVPHNYSFVDQGPYKVPDGQIYLLGDNRPVSDDSRSFGPVPMNRVLGKVIVLP
jgi:signal peptidase I